MNEPDGIRVLQHEFKEPNVSQFLINTRPEVVPRLVAQRVKGRLQHLVHAHMPKAFRRNYSLLSIGSTRRYNLHLVVVNQERYMAVRDDCLTGLHDMICRAADGKNHRLSRAAIVPDHMSDNSVLGEIDWVIRLRSVWDRSGPQDLDAANKTVEYLARYANRVAVSNSRLVVIEGDKVLFSYKDYRDGGQWKKT